MLNIPVRALGVIERGTPAVTGRCQASAFVDGSGYFLRDFPTRVLTRLWHPKWRYGQTR